jgi:hypothetical protein
VTGGPRDPHDRGFRRGLRNKHPLVLLTALILLVPALLGLEAVFTSGAWTAVGVQRWVRTPTDDYMYVSWSVGELKRRPPDQPLVVLLGGSSGREALVDGPSLAADIRDHGGPAVAADNLSSRMQRFAQSLAIVDNLPDTPTTVLVGVNLGRFDVSKASNFRQVVGRELLLKSDTLRHFVNQRYGEYRYSFSILPGVFSSLATYAQQKERDLITGHAPRPPYKPHPFDGRRVLSDERKRELVQKWLDMYYPRLVKNVDFNAAVLDVLVRRAQERGLDVVLVDLPVNREIVGDSFAEAEALYKTRTRAVAERRGVPYLDFNDQLSLTSADFLDLSHLRPAGREVWQGRLAEELARLYAEGAIDGGGGGGE